jgi:hypothetical protein
MLPETAFTSTRVTMGSAAVVAEEASDDRALNGLSARSRRSVGRLLQALARATKTSSTAATAAVGILLLGVRMCI